MPIINHVTPLICLPLEVSILRDLLQIVYVSNYRIISLKLLIAPSQFLAIFELMTRQFRKNRSASFAIIKIPRKDSHLVSKKNACICRESSINHPGKDCNN